MPALSGMEFLQTYRAGMLVIRTRPEDLNVVAQKCHS